MRSVAFVLAALLLALAPPDASAQAPAAAEPLVGDWEGTLDLGPVDVRLVLRVAGGTPPAVTLDSPDQGAFGFEADTVRALGPRLTAVFSELSGRFVGTVGPAGLAGRWRQAGRDFPSVVLQRTSARPSPTPAPALFAALGGWEGDGLSLDLRPGASPDTLRAALAAGVSEASGHAALAGDSLAVSTPGAELRVRLDSGELRGTVRRDGRLGRVALRPRLAARAPRPQTPEPPFPYREVELAVESAPGVRLGGTLVLPPGDGPFPAVVMASGSGPQDRDQTVLGHRPFALLADRLARAGIASYRFDDRGVGASTGDFDASALPDFAADVRAAVAALRARPELREVGVLGHSEGGYVAARVAADTSAGVAFVVSLAGPAVPGREVYAEQHRRIAETLGVSARGATLYGAAVDALAAAVVAGEPRVEAERAFQTALARVPAADRSLLGYTGAGLRAQTATLLDFVGTPWARAFLGYAPRPALRALRVPTLMLFGELDVQVPADQSATAARAALVANRGARIVVVDGANHLFQRARTGAIEEYGEIAETMDEGTLDLVVGWIANATGL